MVARTVRALLLLVISLTCSAAATDPGQLPETGGFHTCRETVKDLAKDITKGGGDHAFFITASKVNPAAHLFNVVIPNRSRGGGATVSVMNVVPTKAGVCDGTYTTVAVVASSCKGFGERLQSAPTNYKPWPQIFGDMVVLEKGRASIALVPYGADCLMVTGYVEYGSRPSSQTRP